MSRAKNVLPSYSLHKPSGKARVRIDGHDFYLGDFGSEESRRRYGELVAKLAGGQKIDPLAISNSGNSTTNGEDSGPSVAELIRAYFRFADAYYLKPDGTPTDEIHCLNSALKPVRELFAFKRTRSGCFDRDHLEEAVEAILELEDTHHPTGIYITLNPVSPELLARAFNRITKANKTTSDGEIVRRRWILIDFDPIRPAGVSSTDEELANAKSEAKTCYRWLLKNGWPKSSIVIAMSGNGYHLLLRIDLPSDDGGLVKQFLKSLKVMFPLVDTSNHNAGRITKCYWTRTRKGDSTSDRPHRLSNLIEVPEVIEIVPLDRIEWLAGMVPEKTQPVHQGNRSEALDIPLYLRNRGIAVLHEDTYGDSHRWFIECPCVASHTTPNAKKDCVIYQDSSGKIGGKCVHNNCGMHSWSNIRDASGAVGPGDFSQKAFDTTQSNENDEKRELRLLTAKNKLENRGKLLTAQMFVPFPLGILPPVVRVFCQEIARSICCDPTLVILPVLAVMAAVIGNSRRVVIRKTWTEPAIIWTVSVADSGSGKSPAFDAAKKPLHKLQVEAAKQYEQDLAQYQIAKSVFDHQKKGAKGVDAIPEPIRPEMQDIYADDTTVEALIPVLENRPRGSAIVCEELSGWFNRLNAYKQQGGGDEAFYLSAHGGRSAKVNRKSGPKVFIPAAVLSITGTIQKPILKQVLNSTAIGNGMAARFLFAMPPESKSASICNERDQLTKTFA